LKLAPEDSARQRASGGLFLCPQNRRRITQKTAAQWQYAAGKVTQAEVVSRLSHASVVFCDPFLNIPIDICRRRDSSALAYAFRRRR
jgi:hypothetical protein